MDPGGNQGVGRGSDTSVPPSQWRSTSASCWQLLEGVDEDALVVVEERGGVWGGRHGVWGGCTARPAPPRLTSGAEMPQTAAGSASVAVSFSAASRRSRSSRRTRTIQPIGTPAANSHHW